MLDIISFFTVHFSACYKKVADTSTTMKMFLNIWVAIITTSSCVVQFEIIQSYLKKHNTKPTAIIGCFDQKSQIMVWKNVMFPLKYVKILRFDQKNIYNNLINKNSYQTAVIIDGDCWKSMSFLEEVRF